MNGPTFNIGYDPILSNPFPQMVDYSKEIDERVQYLQAMKERMSNTVQPANNPNNSLWSAIDSEIGSLNDEQRNILFSDAKYIQWAIVICLVRRAIRLARLFSCNYGWK